MAIAALDPATVDLLDLHARAGRATRKFVLGITSSMWAAPTNCDMDARALDALFRPHAAEFAASGAFGAPVVVPDASDAQTKLLAMLGRVNRR
jgi:hypothetical protein